MAAAPSSLGTQIREELTCSICLELFTRPKVLPCQHTFCQDCLQNLAGRRTPFQCPNCRQQVRLPRQGVEGLPDSRIIANLCEALQTQATLSQEAREQPQPENRCSFHPSEEVKLYCKQCQVPLCVDCVESHEAHPTMSLIKAIQERRDLITEGRNILESYCSFIRYLRDEEKSLDDQKQQTDGKIEEAYRQLCEQIIQMLTAEKSRLLSEVETNHRQNKGAVQNYRADVLADVADLSSACDGAEHEVAQAGGELLGRESNLTDLVPRLREKTVPSPLKIHHAVFEPTEKFSCTLGKVNVPGAVISTGTAVDKGHHHGDLSKTTGYVRKLTLNHQEKGAPGQVCGIGSKGATVSDEGEILVADSTNHRIAAFSLQGTFVRQFPTVVDGKCTMVPFDVATDGEGNLWVVGGTKSVEFAVQYNKEGRVMRKFDLQRTGRYGKEVNGVAVDTRRNLILVTRKRELGEVLVFKPDGTLVQMMGQYPALREPWDICVDGEGRVVVTDNYCRFHQVHIYQADGECLLRFGGRGRGEGELDHPQGVCTDRAGNIIVADTYNDRVELFDKTGKFLNHITASVTFPSTVAMTREGELVVIDSDA
ncbi:tripartite motif-containing protein 3-like [Branchiostoma lanceolatum]|uniref:tripartite motif-containing protein 3-like n=1 Tax=Branchiostoma lanceolatum TaxID=7740 RepID=UPI003453CC8F